MAVKYRKLPLDVRLWLVTIREAKRRIEEAISMHDISFTVHIFKEGEMYVAYVPELDLSSCGATDDEARKNVRDAVQGFLETSADMGTLNEVLEQAGYS